MSCSEVVVEVAFRIVAPAGRLLLKPLQPDLELGIAAGPEIEERCRNPEVILSRAKPQGLPPFQHASQRLAGPEIPDCPYVKAVNQSGFGFIGHIAAKTPPTKHTHDEPSSSRKVPRPKDLSPKAAICSGAPTMRLGFLTRIPLRTFEGTHATPLESINSGPKVHGGGPP